MSLILKHIKNHFRNYCAVIKKNSGINCFWSIDNSVDFVVKFEGMDKAVSIKTYDFSTLYTNLPLDYIFDMLKALILKMFDNSRCNSLYVNADRKKAFWNKGESRTGYKEYTRDDLLDALHYILFNTYVQFAGNIFKQTQGIPMGGNASPFIADLCLAWAEYCFMMELSKSKDPSDFELAKDLNNNSRYIDDISVLNFLGFGELAKRIYHKELILEESTSGYHYDHFLDLNIRVHNDNFVTGIYHKVDDFSFEVISFPFPESNIHSKVGYNSFYSQLVRFFRLCNNVNDFATRVKMLFFKLRGRGYSESILTRYFLKFCGRYPVDLKYGCSDGESLWAFVMCYQASRSCSIYDYEAISEIVKPCTVVLEDMCPSENVVTVNKPADAIPLLSDSPPSDYVNIRGIVPQSIENPKNHCYINSVLQVIYRIFMHYNEGIHTNTNREGCLVQCLVDGIYSDSIQSLSLFKTQLARYNSFFDGDLQRDALECWYTMLDVMHIGTKENLLGDANVGGIDDDQFIYSLTKRLFLFNLKHTTQCLSCRFRTTTTSETQSHILYPSRNTSINKMLDSSLKTEVMKRCGCCDRNTDHEISSRIELPPEILVLVINRFDISLASNLKNKDAIQIDNNLTVSSLTYDHIATIHHHGRTIASGHYTSSILYSGSAFTCNDNHITPLIHSETSDSAYIAFYARVGVG